MIVYQKLTRSARGGVSKIGCEFSFEFPVSIFYLRFDIVLIIYLIINFD